MLLPVPVPVLLLLLMLPMVMTVMRRGGHRDSGCGGQPV
jgi:hypothetical protein